MEEVTDRSENVEELIDRMRQELGYRGTQTKRDVDKDIGKHIDRKRLE